MVALAACWPQAQSRAEDALHVGKAVPNAFTFVPVDIGDGAGIFKKHAIKVEISSFGGDAKLVQAIAAGDIDIGIGGGPDMAFIAKGSPMLAVASVVGPPSDLALVVGTDSPIKSFDDLKGRRIGISTEGSLTAWLAAELIRVKGWQPQDLTTVALGDISSRLAALRTEQIDVCWTTLGVALQVEDKHEGRVLGTAADYVHDFVAEAIFASNHVIESNPAAVRAFIAGWIDTIEFMRQNKAEAVRLARKSTNFSEAVENREYDLLMPAMTRNGRFDKKALAVLQRSFVPLGLLDREPDIKRLYTEKFLP
jgi:ABC-type nitrate/sulfonate/bicarbonate transport system substrate-binding protein